MKVYISGWNHGKVQVFTKTRHAGKGPLPSARLSDAHVRDDDFALVFKQNVAEVLAKATGVSHVEHILGQVQ